MSVIPDEKIKEVRERLSILEVISDYVSLRKSGANYQGLCPFHGEKTPSFNVNPGREIFHCFGCGVGGNVFSFVMKMEGLTFPEAVKLLARRVGVEIEERPLNKVEKRQQDEKEFLYRINQLAMEFYRNVLSGEPAGEAGRRYLVQRGVDDSTSEAYRLGFAPDKWDGLTRFLERKGIPLEQVEKLGLVRRREGGGYYDTFRNRLIFTIADQQGRPIGFGGRVLDDTLPKYINSPESPIYHKSEVLFGADLAKQAMREQGTVIVVEGYFDHLALYQTGVRQVVATCGTALTSQHLALLTRYAGKVFTLFDSDNAGKKATLRTMDLALGGNLPFFVVDLPEGDDPDSFVKKEGREAFLARLTQARPIFEYYFRDLIRHSVTGSVAGKVAVMEELTARLEKIANPVERELYMIEIARLLEVDVRTLQKKVGGTTKTAHSVSITKPSIKSAKTSTDMLLALMGKYPEIAGKVGECGVESLFPPEFLPVAESLIAQQRMESGIDWGMTLQLISSPEERSRLSALFMHEEFLDGIDPHKAFAQCRQALERCSLKSMKALARELALEEPDSPRYLELLAEIDGLRNKKSQLI